MNEINIFAVDSLWLFGAIAVSFFAGCVYRLCALLGRDALGGDNHDTELEELNQRYDQELLHVRQLHQELLQARQAVERPATPAAPAAGAQVTPATPAIGSRATPAVGAQAKPAKLGVDPFKLAIAGASIEVLMSRCRLSRAEAELVFSVHGAGAGHTANKARGKPRSRAKAPRFALTA